MNQLYNSLISKNSNTEKFNELKTQSIEDLKALSQYVLENAHRVTVDNSTDISAYEHIVKAMLYKSLNGLDKNATVNAIKDKLNLFDNIEDQKLKAGIEKSISTLAEKIHTRCKNNQTPQQAFEEIASNNPNWFMQVMHFFARCLFISTEYNVMREYNKQKQNIDHNKVLQDKQKDIILSASEFKAAEEQAKSQSGSVHPVKKFKKDGDTWFEKGEASFGDKIHTFRHAIIKDQKKREVLAAAILEKMMGEDNTTQYKLKKDENGNISVISKGVKNTTAKDQSGKLTLQKALLNQEDGQYYNAGDLNKRKELGNNIKAKLEEKMNSDKDFQKNFIKLHAWNYILGNPDLHCGNIMINDGKKMIPIDFGLSLNDASKLTPEQSANVLNPKEISWLNGCLLSLRGHKSIAIDEEVRNSVIQGVIQEFNEKKEEIIECTEDTCFALGIGKKQTAEVIRILEKNVERLENLAGLKSQGIQ